MKIACDVQLLLEKNKTGIGKMTEYMLENLVGNKEDEFYLNYFRARRENELSASIKKFDKFPNVHVIRCSWFPHFIFRRINKIISLPYKIFFSGEPDVTQFFNYSVPSGVAGKKAVYVYDVAYKAYPETIQKETMEMLNLELEIACKRADKVITISEFSKSEIIKYLKVEEKKIAVIPCAVDSSIFHPHYSNDDIEKVKAEYGITKEYILYMGTLEPRKNLAQLIEAYHMLKEEKTLELPKLVIAGKKGWNFNNIFELVEKYCLEEDVIFTGYVADENVPYLLTGALCFVFPSLYEGFGMPPLEAMACGVPVISSNIASIPEVVGNAGILVSPDDAKELSEALHELVINVDRRKELGKKGLERSKLFSWEKSANLLREVYKEMIGA